MSRYTNAGVQSVSSARNSSLTEKYRRNGKLQSCEPCRKSKLRCDREFRPSNGQKSPLCSSALSDSVLTDLKSKTQGLAVTRRTNFPRACIDGIVTDNCSKMWFRLVGGVSSGIELNNVSITPIHSRRLDAHLSPHYLLQIHGSFRTVSPRVRKPANPQRRSVCVSISLGVHLPGRCLVLTVPTAKDSDTSEGDPDPFFLLSFPGKPTRRRSVH